MGSFPERKRMLVTGPTSPQKSKELGEMDGWMDIQMDE